MPAVISAFRKGHIWKGYLRFGQTWRTIVTGNHGTVASVLTVLTVLLATIPTVRQFLTGYLLKIKIVPVVAQVALIFLLAILASVLFISYLALRSMPPQDYARIMIGGRPPSEALQVISREIENACKGFLDAEEQLMKPDPAPEAIDNLKVRFARQHRTLLNISALLELASQELDIPLARLRDHIFEYDPAMHRKYFQRAMQNSQLIFDLDKELPRRDQLLKENKWIFDSAKRIIRAQEAMLVYTAIHPGLLQVAATRSTSDATGRYASAVSYVARQVCHAISSDRSWRMRRKEKLIDGLEALGFLVRKQRAHPGFDLHQSCITAWQEAQLTSEAPITPPEKMKEILRTLKEKLNQRKKVDDIWEKELNRMKALSQLSSNIDKGFVRWRKALVGRFQSLYVAWCRNDDPTSQNQKTLLVTHGFSSTVREVFTRGLLTEKELKDKLPYRKIPNIFVVNSGEKGDLDSRLMERDLLASTGEELLGAELPQERRFDNVAAGHEDTLASFLDKNTRVMVVLGAECFDRKGRVIHPWGLKDHGFKRKLRSAAEVCVVVVAEGYKFHQDLPSISQYYRYHLDRIQVYEPQFVDAFVTTRIVMSNAPDRRKKVTKEDEKVRDERRETQGSKGDRRGSDRVRTILRRPWGPLNKERVVKSHEFDLLAPPLGLSE